MVTIAKEYTPGYSVSNIRSIVCMATATTDGPPGQAVAGSLKSGRQVSDLLTIGRPDTFH